MSDNPSAVQPRHPTRRHPTVSDVAAAAGVSTSTVSRALRNSPLINERTRLKVLETMRELGYAPSAIARSLRTRSSPFVGVIVPDVAVEFYAAALKGAQDVLEPAGYQVLVMNNECDPEKEAVALSTLVSHRVGGVLISSSGGYEPCEVPVVFFDQVPGVPGVGDGEVLLDNRGGIEQLLEHLIGHGHRRIAYLGGPAGYTSGDERREAFLAAAAMASLELSSGYVQMSDYRWSEESGERMTANLLSLDRPPSAILAGSETLAIGALRMLRKADIRVPQDIALVCFDDPRLGDLIDPPITAISQHSTEFGQRAAAMLLQRLQGPQPRAAARISAQLVVRRSCGCT
ncbi:MAG: LacI family DNA-binding transcriptional regulator [Solirubrobacteraceae bacterium]|jgi:LacI family transcriptional regulator